MIQGNQVLIDQPIQFGGSQPINSWFTSGQHPITASQALEYSSNTYMVQVALRMMGQDYVTGMTLANTGMKETMKNCGQPMPNLAWEWQLALICLANPVATS